MASTVKTRILIISDTHCAPLRPYNNKPDPVPPFKEPLPSADLLIHCGDLTYTGLLDQYHQTLDMLKDINAPVKLVIAGNHDLSLDRDFVLSHRKNDDRRGQFGGMTDRQAHHHVEKSRNLWTAPDGRAKAEGIIFLDEGTHLIDLPNGAQLNVYASPYTPEFMDWGFAYERDEDRFNPPTRSLSDATNIAHNPIPSCAAADRPVDIVITHGPPWLRLDPTTRGDPAGCPHLLRALMRARPLVHCFGHIHEGWGAELVEWAKNVDQVTSTPTSIQDWKDQKWKRGFARDGEDFRRINVDLDAARENRCVFVDMSREGGKGLMRGAETLMVNAAIMDVEYRPVNAPWVVSIDLPSSVS